MAQIPSTNISLSAIQAETGYSTTSNISLANQSANAPGGSATLLASPYGMGEFAGYQAVYTTFTMRGNETGSPSVGMEVYGEREGYDQAQAGSSIYTYVYYRTNGSIGISADLGFGGDTSLSHKKWYDNSGTTYTLNNNSASSQPTAPSVIINNIPSGYAVSFALGLISSTNQGVTSSTQSYNGGNLTLSSGWYQHSGTVTIPTQTSTQASAEPSNNSYPISAYLSADVDAEASAYSTSFAFCRRYWNFRYTFTKANNPTYTIYLRGNLEASASTFN